MPHNDHRTLLVALRPYARHQPSCAYLACILRARRDAAAMTRMVVSGCPPCDCGFEEVLRSLPDEIRSLPYEPEPPWGTDAIRLLAAEAPFEGDPPPC